jgi:DNA repair exonuclease SbcCD ATPase subunit
MKIKHKLLSDFQYISPDKKIFIIKTGTILEEYNYKLKSDIIPIDKEIVDANPEIFNIVDWKAELLTYIKTNKLPTPAVLTKKLIPFIEEIVLSNTSQSKSAPVIDESKIKELESKEIDLNSRERRIKDQEDEIDIRLKRVDKREKELKNDLLSLENKEDELREKSKEIIEKSLDFDDKLQELNERERNLDRTALKSSKEIDSKYKELQDKIDKDLKSLSDKEKELDNKSRSLSKKEIYFENEKNKIDDKYKDLLLNIPNIKKFVGMHNDLNKFIDDITKMVDKLM